MADDPQQPGQPPAGVPAWPPQAPDPNANPQQPGFGAPPPGGPVPWGQPQPQPQPGWGQPPAQPGWGQPPAPGFPPPAPGGFPPPQYGQPAPQYGQPGGYPPAGFPPPGYPPVGYPPVGFGFPPRYAGFWIRFVAFIIDFIIWVVAITVAAISLIVIVGFVLLPVVFFGFFPLFWWKKGATPGMSLLGLRIVRAIDGGPIDGGMAAIRGIVFYLEMLFGSWLIPLLGFVWAAFEPRKRAWHDMAAGTVVIHTN